MPLFAVSNDGRVYKLLTPHDGHSGTSDGITDCREDFIGNEYVTWQELPYLGVELKQVSAGGRSVWAVGGDRQIYVLVHSIDLPIRIKEEAFENQRWIPLEGFSSRLLPTDRTRYSSEDGLVERKLEDIRLPSMAWQWEESSWRVEASLNGQPLDAEGWTYAVDFPATYHPNKQWSSCVRRRKWVRHRLYTAVDAWAAIEPVNAKDPTDEPFIDVNVGGQNIIGAPKGHLSVWAVTAKGRVLYRRGVNLFCPEGECWEEVTVGDDHEGHEVKQVGVGPMGDAWCVLWDGSALVRAGVTRDHLKGAFWVVLEPPSPVTNALPGSSSGHASAPLSQISVGMRGAWAVTVDGRVWYRRGVRNTGDTKDDTATGRLLGLSWVEMVGNKAVVSVGPNDQVWAIGLEDRHLYVRTGVLLPSEPTGKTWRRLSLPVVPFTPGRQAVIPRKHHQKKSQPKICRRGSDTSLYSTEESLSSSASPVKSSKHSDDVPSTGNVVHLSAYRNRSALVASGNMVSALAFMVNSGVQKPSETETVIGSDSSSKGGGDASESETDSAFGHPHEVEEVWDDDWGSEEDTGFDEALEGRRRDGFSLRSEPLWAWVSGGACVIDPHQNLPWFSEVADLSNLSLEDVSEESKKQGRCGMKNSRMKDIWRNTILHSFKERKMRETVPYKYERAVEISSWVKTAKAFCCLPYPPSLLEECCLELEWISGQNEISKEDCQHSGSLTILSPNRSRTLLQWNLSDIRCVACSKGWSADFLTSDNALSPSNEESEFSTTSKAYSPPCLAVHSMLTSMPLRLQFTSEKDLEDWISIVTSVCCQVQGIRGPPNPGSIWGTSSHGEVFVFDPHNLKEEQWENNGSIVTNHFKDEEENGHYAVQYSFIGKEPPYIQFLHNGMPPGSVLVIQGTVASNAKRFSANLVLGSNKSKEKVIALHFNPRFKSDGNVIIVCNTMLHGVWQKEERHEEHISSLTQGQDFTLSIISNDEGYKILVESLSPATDTVSLESNTSLSSSHIQCVLHDIWFKHRITPGAVSHVDIDGNVTVTSISYASPNVIVNMDSVFWRQLGGHFRQVEATPVNVVWALAYDGTPWVHTGGWGGAFLEGMGEESRSQLLGGGDGSLCSSATSKIQAMSDTRVVHVYENQRWNPLTGYSSVGLPTDRPSWSDRSGRHHRSKDTTKLPSRHWHWATDWSVDFGVSGGVDTEGWQYAIDFPASYHASKCFTDYVRRRRWMRVAKLSTKGPWRPLPHTPLASISLHAEEESGDGDGEGVVSLWAIAANTGEVLFRHGVTKSCPAGVSWECVVGGEQPFICISCGGHNQVWAVGRNGAAYWRFGIKSACPTGQVWVHVEPPPGCKLKQISVAECYDGVLAVYALDTQGILYIRKELTAVFPEGTHWYAVVSGELANGKKQLMFGHVSIGPGGEVWAASAEPGGAVLRRLGSYAVENPGNIVWSRGVTASWQYISTNGWRCKRR